MFIPVDLFLSGFDSFLLVFVRMTGLFVIAPIFGRRNVPTYLKIGFAFFLAIILVSNVSLQKPSQFDNIYGFLLLVFKEFMVGITLGYISYLIFTAIYIAGQLIDMQVGFGMVNVLDPVSNIQIPITSNFYSIISMLVFLMLNGHHALIKALFDSYEYVPLGGAVFSEALLNDVIRIFSEAFVLGFRISAPILAAILITDIALGVISKTVPQLNVFVVGMPLKIILGLLIMIVTIPAFVAFIEVLVNGMNGEMFNFMKHMGK
ncbi:MAG: flagellar biosynthetic protein FliR [Clostridia bacterium]|nr:flagellar biosynthetic protein FliR [Clostridia bacterium]